MIPELIQGDRVTSAAAGIVQLPASGVQADVGVESQFSTALNQPEPVSSAGQTDSTGSAVVESPGSVELANRDVAVVTGVSSGNAPTESATSGTVAVPSGSAPVEQPESSGGRLSREGSGESASDSIAFSPSQEIDASLVTPESLVEVLQVGTALSVATVLEKDRAGSQSLPHAGTVVTSTKQASSGSAGRITAYQVSGDASRVGSVAEDSVTDESHTESDLGVGKPFPELPSLSPLTSARGALVETPVTGDSVPESSSEDVSEPSGVLTVESQQVFIDAGGLVPDETVSPVAVVDAVEDVDLTPLPSLSGGDFSERVRPRVVTTLATDSTGSSDDSGSTAIISSAVPKSTRPEQAAVADSAEPELNLRVNGIDDAEIVHDAPEAASHEQKSIAEPPVEVETTYRRHETSQRIERPVPPPVAVDSVVDSADVLRRTETVPAVIPIAKQSSDEFSPEVDDVDQGESTQRVDTVVRPKSPPVQPPVHRAPVRSTGRVQPLDSVTPAESVVRPPTATEPAVLVPDEPSPKSGQIQSVPATSDVADSAAEPPPVSGSRLVGSGEISAPAPQPSVSSADVTTESGGSAESTQGRSQVATSGTRAETAASAPAPRPVVANTGTVPAAPPHEAAIPQPVAVEVSTAVNAIQRGVHGDGHIRIQLDPPELGTMLVDVARGDDGVIARLEVTTGAAHRAVMETLAELQQSLSRNGVTVDRVEVVLTENRNDGSRQDRGQSSRDGRPTEQRQQGQRQNHEREQREGRPDDEQKDDESELD